MIPMPEGDYVGIVEGPWWIHGVNFAWTGKRFTDGTVRNHIFGLLIIEGTVSGTPEHFTIKYRGGLTDDVRLVSPGLYRGTMTMGPLVVTFTLTKK